MPRCMSTKVCVLVVSYPTDGPLLSPPASSPVQQNSGSVAVKEQTTVSSSSRWLANPIYTSEWTRWLNEQDKISKVSDDKSVYISVGLDGRVRGSGVSLPRKACCTVTSHERHVERSA